MDNTISEVLSFVEENDVKFIRLTFCDLFGVHKNVTIMPSELQRAFTRAIHFEQGAVAGFQKTAQPLFLVPDAGTVSILPWRPSRGRVIRFFCDIRHADGTPYTCLLYTSTDLFYYCIKRHPVCQSEERGIQGIYWKYQQGIVQKFILFAY